MRRLIWPVLFLFLMLLQGSMSVYYTGWLSCDLLLLAVYAYALLRGEKAMDQYIPVSLCVRESA